MNTLTENDDDNDDVELIPVETPPEQHADEDGDEQEDGAEDERLATSDDEHDEDVTTSSNRERRRKRREIQKRAKEASQRELAELRQMVATLTQRVANSETQSLTANVNTASQNLEARLATAMAQVEQAERVMAAAAEAGNGNDMIAAMRIRDAAMQDSQAIRAQQAQVESLREQATAPRTDPSVASFAREWMEANPWYNANGTDPDSILAKSIDAQVAREGFNPGTRRYWEELTDRLAEAFDGNGAGAASRDEGGRQPPRRRAPPTGQTREHAPTNTRREIYVTPERKAAMIEAGVWDDPVARTRMLKAYQQYDRENTAR